MDETYRVSAIWEVSADSDSGSQSRGFFRRPTQQPTFNFAPFFSDACDEVTGTTNKKERITAMAPMAGIRVSPIRRLQRA
jgi:hypothetical protein